MKTLPESPSLDHLRQQAKDVLQQLRSVRPGASLSDALTAEVAAAFGLGTPQGPLVAYERQWAGQAWLLTTDRGRWVVRQLFKWQEEAAVKDGVFEAEILLAETALAAGIRTPRPIRSPAGDVIEAIGGSQWRVFERVTMGPELSSPVDPRHAAAAGRILGRVHRFGLPAPQPVHPWLTCKRPESTWWNLHAACETRGIPWADRLAEAIPGLVDVSDVIEPIDPAGPVVLSACHYAPDAFRIAGPDDLVVRGWDHAGSIPPRWDLGATLAGWCEGVDGGVNSPAARALFAAYSGVAGVPEPMNLGIFSAALSAGMNWLSSRIRIAINPAEGEEERELADRAVPWLLAHPPSRDHFQAILDALR
jgi:hypothetical protein